MTYGIMGAAYDFPSFSEGLSLRVEKGPAAKAAEPSFPFLFGGTFIEGSVRLTLPARAQHFPSFSEGLSLRVELWRPVGRPLLGFPFLFGGTFIEGFLHELLRFSIGQRFPFLFGGTFIEGGFLDDRISRGN